MGYSDDSLPLFVSRYRDSQVGDNYSRYAQNFKWLKITHICFIWDRTFANRDVREHISLPINSDLFTLGLNCDFAELTLAP